MRQSQVRHAVFDICDLVEAKFYLEDDNLKNWVKGCRKIGSSLNAFSSRDKAVRLLRRQMESMNVSHFLIYTPVEDAKLWKGQAVETGLKTRWMEDHLMIYQIVPGSPGERAGFRLGDEILKINEIEVNNAEDPATRSGHYKIERDGKRQTIHLIAGDVQLDSQPSIKSLDGRTALVTLSSFRGEYFEKEAWKDFVKKWHAYDRLIFDLRENAGGNLVSMLRALSPIFCRPTQVGLLKQPRKMNIEPQKFDDVISDDEQIDKITGSGDIELTTFDGYGCYKGSVGLLIGSHTASVSEIFASAIKYRSRAKVFGQPTAGDVVLAIWYDLPAIGPGYTISIPEALYVTREGKKLEGEGVFPQQEIYDDLVVWRKGQDSWIRSALKSNF